MKNFTNFSAFAILSALSLGAALYAEDTSSTTTSSTTTRSTDQSSTTSGGKSSDQTASKDEQSMRQGPCSSDVQQYCSDITPGRGRIAACLKSHDDKISQACSQHIKSRMHGMMSEMKDIHKACSDDVQKFCSDVEPGQGRLMSCLKEHKSDLSASCKAETEQMRTRRGTASAPDKQ